MAHGIPAFIANLGSESPEIELLKTLPLSESQVRDKERAFLQLPIDLAPQLLPIRDFYSTVTSVFSLGMEIPVDVGGGRTGYIDNVFVTNDAHLVLVETKLHSNREAFRDVVAQILQYGIAINGMSVTDFEGCLRKSAIADSDPAAGSKLKSRETIMDRVDALAEEKKLPLVYDFEDKLESYLRTGEMLYLVVSDKVHASVERMTHWLNEKGGGAPYTFGLIELQFYKAGDGKSVAIPRTLLRTKEIARHSVAVKIDWAAKTWSTVTGVQVETEGGGISITEGLVKTAGPPMTKDRLLAEVKAKSDKAYAVVSELLPALDSLELDSRATPTTLQYGLLQDRDFYPLVNLSGLSLYSHIPTRLIATIGDTAFVEHKQALNKLAPFYRPDEAGDPAKKMNELVPPYESLAGKVSEFVAVIAATRDKAVAALSEERA